MQESAQNFRRALFTTTRVAGGPGRETATGTQRVTKGVCIGTGTQFEIVDDYAEPADAHRVLTNAWVGTKIILKKEAAS